TYHFGGTNTTSASQFHVNIGGYNALRGKSYGEIAAESRSMHKSQGFGEAPSYGKNIQYFKTIAGPAPHQSLMDGIHTSWSGVPGGKKVGTLISQALQEFDANHPDKSVPLLVKIAKAI